MDLRLDKILDAGELVALDNIRGTPVETALGKIFKYVADKELELLKAKPERNTVDIKRDLVYRLGKIQLAEELEGLPQLATKFRRKLTG